MKTNYFIPELKTINGLQIPSTPFKDSEGHAIYLDDIFEVTDPLENTCEVFKAEMRRGQYCALSYDNKGNEKIETPLWMIEISETTILGSAIESPELLIKLGNCIN